MKKERIILGIDPGTAFTGYGIITIINNKPVLDNMGYIDLSKIKSHYDKLSILYKRTKYLIDTYKPQELSVEAPFFGKNVQSMLKLGRAQGVVIAAAIEGGLEVFEYSPKEIKMSVTGNGGSSKEQVAIFLKNILNFTELPEKDDATDGLAAAVCHFYKSKVVGKKKSYKNWSDFVNKNPERLK